MFNQVERKLNKKTKFLIIIGIIGFLVSSNFQYVDALCVENQDWYEAPCYGCPGCVPSLEKQKDDWSSYYDYKGVKFMEQKKQDMLDVIQNDHLDEWLASGPKHQNSNVYQYYELHGITNEIMLYGLSQDAGLILVLVVITSVIGIFILKRK